MFPDLDSLTYNLNHRHRGHCVIFNQENFDECLSLTTRTNSSLDVEFMVTLFKDLGFIVRAFVDLRLKEIKDILEDLAVDTDHTDCDAMVIVFMSHGGEDVLYARDHQFHSDLLFKPFSGDECETLVGKPKIFFIQGGRGESLEEGVKLNETRILKTKRRAVSIPSKHVGAESPCGGHPLKSNMEKKDFHVSSLADFLICWSTVDGYYSWRNTNTGSWFIQALAHVLARDCWRDDVLSLMISTARHMMKFSSKNPVIGLKKQMPHFSSTLTKKMYFYPKATYPHIEDEEVD